LTSDVAVIGGGISGMVAAHRLSRFGARVTLIEKTDRLGGIVETSNDDGFIVEGGPDSFVASKGPVLQLADELGLDGEVIYSRPESQGSFVWWDGELHPLPGGLLLMVPHRLRPLFGSSLLSWRGKARVLADLVLPRSGESGDESLESFVTRRLGREVLERIAEPLIAGIHAAEPGTMSLRASFPRFLEMEQRHRSLILAARRAAPRSPGAPSHFASFRKGMGQLVGGLAAALDGVRLVTGVAATSLDTGVAGYELTLGDGSVFTADGVVLATPAPVATALLARVAGDVAHSLARIGQVANAVVTLAYLTEDLPKLDGSGFVVPTAQGRQIRGVSYSSRKWEGRVPSERYTLLRVFIGAGTSPGSEDLVRLAREELQAIVGITASPNRWWVRIHDQGLHRYTLGHEERLAQAESGLAARPGLALAGAGFHGVGLNECIESGWRAADSLLAQDEPTASRTRR
jgi:oxygen-dependent protoporphyrinogen oxidase